MIVPNVPVGARRFHPQDFFDYQLARVYGLGLADGDELERAVHGVRTREALVTAVSALADRAEADGRLLHALGYVRVAEFFLPHGSDARGAAYLRFRALFDRLRAGSPMERHEVPYGSASLPAYRLPATGPARGTVLLHGGFDSLIEEFCAIWERIAQAGWDVVAFEGPGQGGARAAGLTFEHDWEGSVGAVLDHFTLDDVALVGLSMGGYWALRAAGREPRVGRVVSWPPVYDWMAPLPGFVRWLIDRMLRARSVMNLGIRLRMRLFPILDHAVRHAMWVSGGSVPMDAVDWLRGMNADHLGSARVTQDVLLMVGAGDTFQSPRLAELQRLALTGARSVTVRTFTAEEHAERHCQLGNVPLAVEALCGWLDVRGTA